MVCAYLTTAITTHINAEAFYSKLFIFLPMLICFISQNTSFKYLFSKIIYLF